MTERLDPCTVPLVGSRLIEASAGTGKTYTIAALYLRLVLGHGAPGQAFARALLPSEILVMTFTRPATRELSERIRDRLVEAAACFREGRAASDPLMRALLDAHPAGRAREAAAWRLAAAAEAMDDAAVYTIDAWVQRMLREHAFDSGSLFDEEVQPDDATLVAEATRDYWRREVYPLRGDAFDAVRATWADVDRFAADVKALLPHFAGCHAPSKSLEAVWRDASDGRAGAFAALKAGWPPRGAAIRAWIGAQVGMPGKPWGSRLTAATTKRWLDAIDAWAAAPDDCSVPKIGVGETRFTPAGLRDAIGPAFADTLEVPPVFEEFAAMFGTLRAMEPPSHAMRRHAAAGVAAAIVSQKARIGTFGFDDMLRRLDDALSDDRPGAERLRARILAQFPAALIDEFQDTSPLQYRIFDRLYRMADDDPVTALLLIGDPKQSIYGFRGADIHSYLRARAATAGRHHFLATNYRSTTALVRATNHLFGQGDALAAGAFRFGGRGIDGGDDPLPFVPVDAHGRNEVFRTAAGPVPAMTLCHDAELAGSIDAQKRFAGYCAEHIAHALSDASTGFETIDGGFRRLRPADLTVLVRNRYEAAAVRRALQDRGVASVYLSDQNSVFRSHEAEDLLHWLRAVAEPLDSRRARVAFATRLVGLPLSELTQLAHDDLAFEARVADLKALHGEWQRQGVLPMLRATLHRLDLPARWLQQPDGERRLTNFLHLAELLQTASANVDGEQALLRWLADRLSDETQGVEEQIVRLESDADLVRVMTIHLSKGLEFEVVYLPFACSDKPPKKKPVATTRDPDGTTTVLFDADSDAGGAAARRAALDDAQEQLRLLYVAMTRARHTTWLGIAPIRHGNACGFSRSALGYLLSADRKIAEHEIAGRLHAVFDGIDGVAIEAIAGDAPLTRFRSSTTRDDLRPAPVYAATFERDWSIGSFSAFVRNLQRQPGPAMVTPSVEEEVLEGVAEPDVAVRSSAPRHRFPRGALPGNFLHDQLEWLAAQRFDLTDAAVRDQLVRRCERDGWGHRAGDVVAWLSDVVTTPLPALGASLDALPRVLPEMEFWFPSAGVDAADIDALCRTHLLDGRDRPPLPTRSLSGMLMGFADLVCEVDGRYWVVDYKSNALGDDDAAYDTDALAASMASHRYDVQSAVYLLALHRLLARRLGARYDPDRDLGGAVYLFLRGIRGPAAGCYVVRPPRALLDALDSAFGSADLALEAPR